MLDVLSGFSVKFGARGLVGESQRGRGPPPPEPRGSPHFEGRELGARVAEAGGAVGLALLAGPLAEGLLLRSRAGGARASYLLLALSGLLGAAAAAGTPESLPREGREALDAAAVLRSASPFGFVRLFTQGVACVRVRGSDRGGTRERGSQHRLPRSAWIALDARLRRALGAASGRAEPTREATRARTQAGA